MDMAGFAVNIQLLKEHPKAGFNMMAGRGNLESDLLAQLGLEMSDLEPKAKDCSEVTYIFFLILVCRDNR